MACHGLLNFALLYWIPTTNIKVFSSILYTALHCTTLSAGSIGLEDAVCLQVFLLTREFSLEMMILSESGLWANLLVLLWFRFFPFFPTLTFIFIFIRGGRRWEQNQKPDISINERTILRFLRVSNLRTCLSSFSAYLLFIYFRMGIFCKSASVKTLDLYYFSSLLAKLAN